MSVKTIWHIEHACGHPADRDLSNRPADRRAGFAEWLATQECTDCWRAAKQDDEQERAAWLAAKRAEEQAESDAWSQQYEMPPLDGTERAVPWAVRCRHQLMTAAFTALVLEGETTEAQWEQIEDAARTVTRAGWWLDQRASDPEDLPELLQAATDADRSSENPFF
ncbi:hypothetical protein [Streptomyces sp. SID11385]|uniref:hypothetical protein n=1 Tax=Streptomyces sp. SID11385 TaxID=2706031 RepID=UPI0013CA8C93|nr:hypothetical protein [Streptomyces sp. SID11385]NEA37710.1 hypothetical protein [Streptomyces sp. SID11385]NEA43528.1 hypothetical protein [Streptomyces sp. SID11385]